MSFMNMTAAKAPGRHPLLACLLGGALLSLALLPQAAEADTTVSLFKSFAGNINYVTTGNTLRAAPNDTYAGGNACTLLSGLTGASVNAGTSSDPISGIPAGSTIVAAYLYYAGSGATVDSAVTFNGTAVTASRTFTSTTGGHDFFSGFVDVTSLVTGNATYSFGNLAVDDAAADNCTNSTVLAGWALVVIYANTTTEGLRVINVFDGFEAFAGSSITLTPNNFMIPSTGINGKFSVITWEGDPDINSTNGANNLTETLEFNGNVLSDACNPTADTSLANGSNGGAFVSGNPNQYNSTINTLSCTGVLTPTGDEKYFGVDFDTFDISSYLTSGETSGTTFYSTGQDTVFLTAQIVSVSNTAVADLGITKVHNGTFGVGDNGTYTLTVSNSGPSTETGTVTVKDTLPTGESYVSATGTGWTCAFATPTVTCTNPNTSGLATGSSLPAITLTVNILATAPASISNTATVSGVLFDNNSANNSSTDVVVPVAPDLSTSTKTVVNTGGGDALVGSTLQYTITLTESAGVQATGNSVTDQIPANVSGFTPASVTFPSGATNASTATGGTNGTGLLSITGITVPANGSVTIVFTVQVATGTANCATINNTATVTNPNGPDATPAAPTITVAQSSCKSSGNKILYLYDGTGPNYTNLLNRVVQTTNTGTATTVNFNSNHVWTMTPAVATGKTLVLTAGTVTVSLIETNTNTNTGTARPTTVSLLNNGVVVATSGTVNTPASATTTLITYSITIPATTVLAGNALGIQFNNNSTTNNRSIAISQKTATLTSSRVSFATSTVINVDSVTAYNAVYPAITTTTVYVPNTTVYICAVISDPFGSADVTSANITLTDPNGTVQVSGAAMTANGAANCAGTASTATEAFEYTFAIPSTAAAGFWTASVTGHEGTEATVTQTANGSFDVDVPSLLIMKTAAVSTDPVEGATRPKAIPGATVQYTILVQNNGRGPADSGSLVLADAVPTNTAFDLTAATPFIFTDGSTASGLSAPVMTFSNNGGTSYVYSPSCTRPCTDTAITNFKMTFTGSMNGKTGASPPSFSIIFSVIIQ